MSTHPARPSFPLPTHVADGARLLVVYCHPRPHRSRVNKALVDAVRDLPGVTVHELYERYPDGGIDVATEQALLAAHEAVVLQHPFYWYSTPPLLKEWLDVVLTWGWAYGRGGTALRGKTVLTAITTGGREAAYRRDGFNRFTVRELLAPIDQTVHLCGMRYLPPFVVHDTHRIEEAAIRTAAADYRAVVEALRDGRRPPDDAPRANADLAWTLRPVEVS